MLLQIYFYLSFYQPPPPNPPQKEKSQSMQVKVPLLAEGSETLFYQVKHMKQVD